MPPKVKVTKNDIVQAALELCGRQGESAVNARSIVSVLNCSTQPIFSNFETMEELLSAVQNAAFERYLGFLEREAASGAYPRYKAFGMAYIRFAKEEKNLFRLLFMRERNDGELSPTADFTASVDMIMQANGISLEQAERVHLEMWACVHGIGTMLATSFLSLEWDVISDMLTDVYQGLCAKYQKGEIQACTQSNASN